MVVGRSPDHAGGDDVRPRHDRFGGRSDTGRCHRLSGKTDCPAKTAGDSQEGPEARGHAGQAAADAGRLLTLAPAQGSQETSGTGGLKNARLAAQERHRQHRRNLCAYLADPQNPLARPFCFQRTAVAGNAGQRQWRYPLCRRPDAARQVAAEKPDLRLGASGKVQAATDRCVKPPAVGIDRTRLGTRADRPARRSLVDPATDFQPPRRGAGNRHADTGASGRTE